MTDLASPGPIPAPGRGQVKNDRGEYARSPGLRDAYSLFLGSSRKHRAAGFATLGGRTPRFWMQRGRKPKTRSCMDHPAVLNLCCAKIVWLDSCFLVRIRLSRPLFFAADPPCPGPPPPICPGPEKVLLPRLSQAASGPAARPPACAGRPGGAFLPPSPFFVQRAPLALRCRRRSFK